MAKTGHLTGGNFGFSGSFQNNINLVSAAYVGSVRDLARSARNEMSFANGTFAEANSKPESGGTNKTANTNEMSHNSILSGGISSSDNQHQQNLP